MNYRTILPAIAAITFVLLHDGCSHVGTHPAAGAVYAATLRIPVTVTSPKAGFVSLGLYDSTGRLIRSLAYAKPVTAGPQSFNWDGTTDLGLPAAAGEYHAKGIWFGSGPQIHYQMKIGLSGTPPYPTEDGTGAWGANLGAAWTVTSNSKNVLAAFACIESREITGIQLMDPDGHIIRRFDSFYGWDTRHAAVMDDSNLYLVLSTVQRQLFLAKYDLDNPKGKILCNLPSGDHFEASGRWKGRGEVIVRGVALNGGRVYVPVMLDDKIFVVDASTGQQIAVANVPSPRGMAVHNGVIYALSGGSLIKVDANGNPVGSPIVTGLDDPAGLVIDSDGTFYISLDGTSQQVRVFTASGVPAGTIGKAGGRSLNGLYDPRGMLDPRGLCIAPDGKVWVAEANEDYQRIGVWSKDGKLLKEYFNSRISAGQGKLTPDRQDMLMLRDVYSDVPSVSAYRVDWKAKTWYPDWHLDMPYSGMQDPSVLVGNTHIFGQVATSFDGHAPYLSFADGMIKGDNGLTYLYGGDFSIYCFDPVNIKTRLAAVVYMHRVEKLPSGIYTGDYDTGPNQWFAWADTNGDGKMSLGGVTLAQGGPLLAGVERPSSWELEPDLSIVLLCGDGSGRRSGQPTKWSIYRLKPTKILSNGAPVYDWSTITKVVDLQVPDLKGGDGYKGPIDVYLGHLRIHDNAAYTIAEPRAAVPVKMTGIDGDGWWASRNWRSTLLRFDMTTGQSAWLKLGRRAPGLAEPGQMYYTDNGDPQKVDNFDILSDVLGKDWIWTDDGLYVGGIYNGPSSKIMDANGVYVESTGSFVYKIDGADYVLTGDTGVLVHQLVIPDLTKLDGGTVTLSAAQSASAAPWDPDGPPPGKRPVYVARSIYNFDPKVAAPVRTITIDGHLDPAEWGGIPASPILLDGKAVGSVQAVFDKTNLYLAYTVHDPVGFKNAGTELPLLPFTSGAYVDFRLGPPPGDPARTTAEPGDVRVLLTQVTGAGSQPYQVGYWPIKPGGKNPQTIYSAAAQRHFDDISPVPGLKWAWEATPDGYTVEVQVPFNSIGLNGQRTPVIGFDASIAFANPAGTVRDRAAHWDGESEAQVVDRPGSSALDQQDWGTMAFDKTAVPAALAAEPAP